jgi:hypothetical protein
LIRVPPATKLLVATGIAIVVCVTALTPAAGNLWLVATGRGFFIPRESSIWTFHATQMNPGSGEWWTHGEDRSNLYGLHPARRVYLVMPRAGIEHCPGFNAMDLESWCVAREVAIP